MPKVTTQSGQARRLISLFQEAQRLARSERKRATALQEVIDTAVAEASAEPADESGRVCLHIGGEAWQRLTAAANRP